MDIKRFLNLKPMWATQPCLYIIKLDPSPAARCGASGTKYSKDSADRPYGSKDRGLLDRMQMYQGYYNPLKTKIYAALRVPKALAAADHHRVQTDADGNPTYNMTKGSHTLVLVREKQFHAALDKRKMRFEKDSRNELFTFHLPTLLSAMRAVKGLEMYRFTEDRIYIDPTYNPTRLNAQAVTMTEVRKVRQPRTPTVYLKITQDGVEEFKIDRPEDYEELKRLMNSSHTYSGSKASIEKIKNNPKLVAPLRDAYETRSKKKAT